MTASKERDDEFSLPAGNSRRRRRLKKPGSGAPGFTGAWGRQPPTSERRVYTGALLAATILGFGAKREDSLTGQMARRGIPKIEVGTARKKVENLERSHQPVVVLEEGRGQSPTAFLRQDQPARSRYRKVTICPRVQVSSGPKVVAVTPLVMPLDTAQDTALL